MIPSEKSATFRDHAVVLWCVISSEKSATFRDHALGRKQNGLILERAAEPLETRTCQRLHHNPKHRLGDNFCQLRKGVPRTCERQKLDQEQSRFGSERVRSAIDFGRGRTNGRRHDCQCRNAIAERQRAYAAVMHDDNACRCGVGRNAQHALDANQLRLQSGEEAGIVAGSVYLEPQPARSAVRDMGFQSSMHFVLMPSLFLRRWISRDVI